VKAHIKEQPKTFERFGVQWTPVLVIFDPQGKEQHRWEGYLPPDEFRGQLELGLAKSQFAQGNWAEAERQFRAVLAAHPTTDYAPLALYYAGVSRYKGGDQNALAETGRALRERYPDTSWAKKGSVWLPEEAQGSAHA
jgi:hypothetical protein